MITKIRHQVRLGLAIIFWLHALGFTGIAKLWSIQHSFFHGKESQFLLIVVILFYSLLASNGWLSLSVDLAFIYVFPIWVLFRSTWILSKTIAKTLFRDATKSVDGYLKEVFKELIAQRKKRKEDEALASKNKSKQPLSKTIMARVIMPFCQFAPLWCIVILVSRNRALLCLSSAALFFSLVRLSISFSLFLKSSVGWLDQFEANLAKGIKDHLVLVMNAGAPIDEVKKHVRALQHARKVIGFLRDNSSIERLVALGTTAFAVPYYLYLSSISGFLYYAIAEIANQRWSIGEAVIDAFVVPFAFTDLPHIFIIRALAGCQILLIITLGYAAIWRRIQQRADRIKETAQNLAIMISTPEIEGRISYVLAQPSEDPEPSGRNESDVTAAQSIDTA